MNSTDTYSLHNSQEATNFVKETYFPLLRQIRAHIQEYVTLSTKALIKDEKKFQSIPKSLIPDSRDVRDGFENMEQIIEGGHFLLIGNTLFVPYITSGVGKFFYTNWFQRELPSLPGTKYPGFAITLKKKEEENDQLSDEFEVEFMDDYGDHNTGDHLEFVLWFAPKLAMKYLEWCIERKEAASKISITDCYNWAIMEEKDEEDGEYKSTHAAAHSSTTNKKRRANKKQRTNNNIDDF
jgi:hypothetical protein